MLIKPHAGSTGIRVNVLKPYLDETPATSKRHRWTCVYVGERNLTALLELAHDDISAVTNAVRAAALTVRKKTARSFSAHCVAGARQYLARQRAEAEAFEAQQAAENNACWQT